MRRYSLALAAVLALALTNAAHAEMVRFCFVPVDAGGKMQQVACGPDGATGELFQGLGLRRQPYSQAPRPTHLVTFRHTNGRNVTAPLTLPEGPPQINTRADRIVYSYGMYVVEVRFVGDGGVDLIYNSGLLRPLVFP